MWLFCCMVMLNELCMKSQGNNIWREANRKYVSALPMVHMARKKTNLKHIEYSILDYKADLLL